MKKKPPAPAEEIDAAYEFVERMVSQADGYQQGSPWWYGYALRKAFMAGIEWQQAQGHQEEEIQDA